MFDKLIRILIVFNFLHISFGSDPHESIARRTPSGIPYYLKNHELNSTFYTTTGLIIFEFETDNFTYHPENPILNWNGVVKIQNMVTTLRSNCMIGDLFHGLFFSQTEKLKFLGQLQSSCFSNKVYTNPSNYEFSGHEDINIWRHALSECKAGRIPDSLVAPRVLYTSLMQFRQLLHKSTSFKLSYPVTDVSVYYKIQSTSCSLTENSIVVAIQVPLIPKEDDMGNSLWKSYEFIPVPVWDPNEQDTVCLLQDRVGLLNFDEGIYLHNFITKSVTRHSDNCQAEFNPCLLSAKISKRSMKRSCIQAIIEGKDEDIVCRMHCEPSATFNFPIIRMVASDRYLIVADLKSSEEVRVECPPFQKEEILTFPPTGALEIIVPCDCHIRYMNITFKAKNPCGAEFSKIPLNFPGIFDKRESDTSIQD
ncbi:unnamed protein product [Orchesella dallaii]|uniref:Uncharacterized protein n=1 Tax=Orchesella dallaii TaxID=48710 RepID=A0ABP1QX55_9HEXA